MNTLVTGGTGFIGAALVRALVSRGDRVRSLDNGSRGAVRRLGDAVREVELLNGDIRDSTAVVGAMRGIDHVVHLAYVNGTEHLHQRPELRRIKAPRWVLVPERPAFREAEGK